MRVELIHPMLVHFPIALLIIGVMLKSLGFLLRKFPSYSALLFSSRLIILFGVLFAWAAVIAGGYAEEVVRSSLCFPNILDLHMNLGWATAFIFTIALVLDWPRKWINRGQLHKYLTILSSVLFMIGFGFIAATGAFGGSLVYDQGAAVENKCPSNIQTPPKPSESGLGH